MADILVVEDDAPQRSQITVALVRSASGSTRPWFRQNREAPRPGRPGGGRRGGEEAFGWPRQSSCRISVTGPGRPGLTSYSSLR